eukprot:c17491_g1_i2 orf=803-3313(+)
MTMKCEKIESSCSSLSSSCSDGNSLEINHCISQPNYLVSRKAKSRKAKSSSEEPNSSDEDGSRSSVNTGSFQEEKQLSNPARKISSLKLAAPPCSLLARKDSSVPLQAERQGNNEDAIDARPKKGSSEKRSWDCEQAGVPLYMKEARGKGTNPMDREVSSLLQVLQERSPPATMRAATTKTKGAGLRQEPITLIKSSSVSSTRADSILKVDYITTSSAHNKLGHRLSTGDSPLNLQKRYGSQGPASLRTSFASPGTPSRSSFSGVPTSMQMISNKAYMVGRIAVNEGTGKLLPLYNLPPSNDQDTINPGRLSVSFSSRAAPPSKWDDAEKWLVNASPSHPSQLPPHPSSKQATYTNSAPNYNAESKKNPTNNKRVINVLGVPSSPSPSSHKQAYTHSSEDHANMQYQSRSLVPLPSSSSDSQVHEDSMTATMSDSELSNTQDECKVFVRSTSHKHIKESDHGKHRSSKNQLSRKSMVTNSKEELHISSPVALQLERLKLGSSSAGSHHEQLPKMHDVYAVETTALRHAGAFADGAPTDTGEVADGEGGGNGLARLVVQAGKVVGRWGAGAMRDASTDVSPKVSMSRRDMGTQMTPVASSKTSRSATPLKNSSPVRHNTPARAKSTSTSSHSPAHTKATSSSADPRQLELEGLHLAKLEKGHVTQTTCHAGSESTSLSTTSHETSSSRKSFQDSASDHHTKDQNSSLKVQDMESLKTQENSAAAQYSAWEEAERSKYMTKCAREEARIDAWEQHQKAKGEAEMKKLEMKLERLRAQATEKIMNKMAAAHLRAEEMRAAARAQQAEQLAKSLERANSISRKGSGYFPESLGVCFSIMP